MSAQFVPVFDERDVLGTLGSITKKQRLCSRFLKKARRFRLRGQPDDGQLEPFL